MARNQPKPKSFQDQSDLVAARFSKLVDQVDSHTSENAKWPNERVELKKAVDKTAQVWMKAFTTAQRPYSYSRLTAVRGQLNSVKASASKHPNVKAYNRHIFFLRLELFFWRILPWIIISALMLGAGWLFWQILPYIAEFIAYLRYHVPQWLSSVGIG